MGHSELEQWVTGQRVIGSWVNKMLYGSWVMAHGSNGSDGPANRTHCLLLYRIFNGVGRQVP